MNEGSAEAPTQPTRPAGATAPTKERVAPPPEAKLPTIPTIDYLRPTTDELENLLNQARQGQAAKKEVKAARNSTPLPLLKNQPVEPELKIDKLPPATPFEELEKVLATGDVEKLDIAEIIFDGLVNQYGIKTTIIKILSSRGFTEPQIENYQYNTKHHKLLFKPTATPEDIIQTIIGQLETQIQKQLKMKPDNNELLLNMLLEQSEARNILQQYSQKNPAPLIEKIRDMKANIKSLALISLMANDPHGFLYLIKDHQTVSRVLQELTTQPSKSVPKI